MNKPKILILGLDGATIDLVRHFANLGAMPFFARLLKQSAWGTLDSTSPPTTLPAWTSFLTGSPPSFHGVPDFTVRQGYRVKFVGGGHRRLPTWLAHLEAHRHSVGSAWFPATYPPEPLRGFQIAGWDSPVTTKGDGSFVHPPELHAQMAKKFGFHHLAFDAVDEFSDSPHWYEHAAAALRSSVRHRGAMALWLLENRPTDVAAFYFGESDTVAHHFWAHHDPRSPRRPTVVSETTSRAIQNVYRELDTTAQTLYEHCGEKTHLVVLSDHGSGGSSDWVVHLNRFLESIGLLVFESRQAGGSVVQTARNAAVARIPRRVRRGLFRAFGGALPSLAESALRFGAIDWDRTSAFSEEINYAPGIWFNQLGREPRGQVRPQQRAALTKRIAEEALQLTTPDGSPLVSRVVPRESLHRGPLTTLFPDLILEMAQIDGYTPCVLPSAGRSGHPVSRLQGADLLGRKGRSMPGCHTPQGMLMVAGPNTDHRIIQGASIQDVAAIICSLAGVPPADWFQCAHMPWLGKPIGVEAIAPVQAAAPVFNRPASEYTRSEEQTVAKRLKRLGYLED